MRFFSEQFFTASPNPRAKRPSTDWGNFQFKTSIYCCFVLHFQFYALPWIVRDFLQKYQKLVTHPSPSWLETNPFKEVKICSAISIVTDPTQLVCASLTLWMSIMPWLPQAPITQGQSPLAPLSPRQSAIFSFSHCDRLASGAPCITALSRDSGEAEQSSQT